MKWVRRFAFLAVFALFLTSCDAFRPRYPATFTPVPVTETRAAITLQPTRTLTPTAIVITPTPRTSALDIVWAINPADKTVIGIDPYSQRVVDTLPVDGVPQGIVTGEGGIWVLTSLDSKHSLLMRIDPYSRLAMTHIPAMEGEAGMVASGGGYIWLSVKKDFSFNEAAGGGVEYSRDGAVLQVDPNPSKISQSYPIAADAIDIFPDGETLWVLANRNTYSVINKVNTVDQTLVTLPEALQVSTDAMKYAHFTKLGNWLWMTPQNDKTPYIYKVSPDTGLLEKSVRMGYRYSDTPVEITQDGEWLWVALADGTVVQLDPETEKSAAVIDTQTTRIQDLFFAAGFLWAVDEENSQIAQIDIGKGVLVSSYSTGSETGPRATPTITETVNPNLIWALCGKAFLTNLQVGDHAQVNTDPPIPNRVRSEAGGDGPIIGYIEPGEIVKILDGPICLNRWVWWKVSSLTSDLIGWTSEGDGVDYWLVPAE